MKNIICILLLLPFSSIAFTQESPMNPKEMKAYMNKAALRTHPDYVCFIPGSYDRSTRDSDNEHFLVFDGPDGSLMAVWTQHQGTAGWNSLHTGTMSGMYSDDNGRSWSRPQDIPMPKSPYDDPGGKVPPEWIVWQKPERAPDGKYTIGYSRWVNKAVAYFNGKDRLPSMLIGKSMSWVWWESVVEFMKFENLDSNPEPADLKISYHAWGDQALRVPHYLEPCLSVAQEPSIVTLPDNRLFCTMRTGSGYIWYTLSGDNGKTWCNPRPLLREDHGSPILQPVSCCPIYQLDDGRYILLHHNNRGDISDPSKIAVPRTPAYIALGEFRPAADQPIWFSESKVFVDNQSLNAAGEETTTGSGVATYTSFTTSTGKNILWYPDAKCWLLEKEVSNEFLKDLKVPSFTVPKCKGNDRQRKSNVVVLFIDDLGYGDVGAFGCPDIPTPNIDRLASQGVRCTNAYTVCPVFCPAWYPLPGSGSTRKIPGPGSGRNYR
jgi:hypothetical protein